jgi:hypothetical protein
MNLSQSDFENFYVEFSMLLCVKEHISSSALGLLFANTDVN